MNIVFSYSLEYELFMGLILGHREKEKRSNLLTANLLERLFCGERGTTIRTLLGIIHPHRLRKPLKHRHFK